MEKKINRKELTRAIREILSQQRRAAINTKEEEVRESMKFDERILVLDALKEIHPFLKKVLESAAQELILEEIYAKIADLPNAYLSSNQVDIIRGQLELMTDNEIRAYTLEELVDIVKDK